MVDEIFVPPTRRLIYAMQNRRVRDHGAAVNPTRGGPGQLGELWTHISQFRSGRLNDYCAWLHLKRLDSPSECLIIDITPSKISHYQFVCKNNIGENLGPDLVEIEPMNIDHTSLMLWDRYPIPITSWTRDEPKDVYLTKNLGRPKQFIQSNSWLGLRIKNKRLKSKSTKYWTYNGRK